MKTLQKLTAEISKIISLFSLLRGENWGSFEGETVFRKVV